MENELNKPWHSGPYALLLVFLAVVFFVGFHNADQAVNLIYVGGLANMTFVENNLIFKNIGLDFVYMFGMSMMILSFLFVVFLCAYPRKK